MRSREAFGAPCAGPARTPLSFGPSVLPGSELEWRFFANIHALQAYLDLAFQGAYPPLNLAALDFEQAARDLGLAFPLAPATNPDLRRFRARGGKLITLVGAADGAHVVGQALDHYETAMRTMGGAAATQDFYRLFLVPGMGHCSGGPGPWAIDLVGALDRWVGEDAAPRALLGHRVRPDWPRPSFPLVPTDPALILGRQPLYPYPSWPRYTGRGSPGDPRSYVAAPGNSLSDLAEPQRAR